VDQRDQRCENQKFATRPRKKEKPSPRERETETGGKISPRAKATPAGNSRRHRNTPEASPCAPGHPRTPQTLPPTLLGTHPFRSPLPPSVSPASLPRCFFHPEPPAEAPLRARVHQEPGIDPRTSSRSYVFYGVLLTTKSSAIHPLAFSPFVLVHSDLAPVSLGSFGLPFFPTVFTPPPLSPFTIKNRYWISACFHRPPPFSTRLTLVARLCSLMWSFLYIRFRLRRLVSFTDTDIRLHYRVFALKEYNCNLWLCHSRELLYM